MNRKQVRLVQKHLREYVARELFQEEVEQSIAEIDEGLETFAGMELKQRQKQLKRLEEIKGHARRMEAALSTLSEKERELIERCYFTIGFSSHEQAAERLKLSIDEFYDVRDRAMEKLFNFLYESRKTINI